MVCGGCVRFLWRGWSARCFLFCAGGSASYSGKMVGGHQINVRLNAVAASDIGGRNPRSSSMAAVHENDGNCFWYI